MIYLVLAQFLGTPVPPGGPTPEWEFINWSEMVSPSKVTLRCDFEDVEGKKYVVSLKQSHGAVALKGGFEAWLARNFEHRIEIPSTTTIQRDDTNLFSSTELPEFAEWSNSLSTQDKRHEFSLRVSQFPAQQEARPAWLLVVEKPPSAVFYNSGDGPEPGSTPESAENIQRPSSLAGFCNVLEERNAFTFEELDRLGRESQ